ncbi:MAG: SDR family NAD(P)-dependent oxidoreductase [Bacteroidetes bacterium]|nr:SDR family NAD(P)-dependent oxidoreductase [Bacteroidota bacterium]MCW5896262.1 SDR family NAD(P)-dependent oxidoreductase [Bacteroidota bacterium]
MKRLDQHVALVTGASKGIGLAIARSLAVEGASVVLAARNASALARETESLHSQGLSALAVPTDMTDDLQVGNLVAATIKEFGRIDILVNNAGMGVLKRFAELDVKDFDTMWSLNMRSVFVLTKLVLPYMTKANSGAIVNIASLAGKNSFVGGTGYATTKWALRGWASSLMLEVREYNIRVVTICPGSVETTFSSTGKRGAHIPQAEDVADAVVFAVTAPARSMFSEIDLRPTNPK